MVTAPDMIDVRRRLTFAQLCEEEFGATPTTEGPHQTTGEEDAAEVLYGDEALMKYAVVTSGGEHSYLYNVNDFKGVAATLRDISSRDYGETVMEVVDLDTKEAHYPDWTSLKFFTTS